MSETFLRNLHLRLEIQVNKVFSSQSYHMCMCLYMNIFAHIYMVDYRKTKGLVAHRYCRNHRPLTLSCCASAHRCVFFRISYAKRSLREVGTQFISDRITMQTHSSLKTAKNDRFPPVRGCHSAFSWTRWMFVGKMQRRVRHAWACPLWLALTQP